MKSSNCIVPLYLVVLVTTTAAAFTVKVPSIINFHSTGAKLFASQLDKITENKVDDDQTGAATTTKNRRSLFEKATVSLTALLALDIITQSQPRNNNAKTKTQSSLLLSSRHNEEWKGTSLPLLSFDEAFKLSNQYAGTSDVYPFAQWPDPILRRPASRFPVLPTQSIVKNDDDTIEYGSNIMTKLQSIAKTLQRTAHEKGAVGLAAQQCGIDISMVYLQTNRRPEKDQGLFLLNPRIIARSPEQDMRVWTEECLVLPPSFRATLLRDALVTVEYETIFPSSSSSLSSSSSENTHQFLSTQQVSLDGDAARCVQHEMQHDAGILILDHVGLDELPLYMKELESEGHSKRMQQAYQRDVAPSSLLAATSHTSKVAIMPQHERRALWQEKFVPRANAIESPTIVTSEVAKEECNDECLAERGKIIEERRAMMQQSRTNTRRQDVFELSRQRASMYNTTYKGMDCPPSVPCI